MHSASCNRTATQYCIQDLAAAAHLVDHAECAILQFVICVIPAGKQRNNASAAAEFVAVSLQDIVLAAAGRQHEGHRQKQLMHKHTTTKAPRSITEHYCTSTALLASLSYTDAHPAIVLNYCG